MRKCAILAALVCLLLMGCGAQPVETVPAATVPTATEPPQAVITGGETELVLDWDTESVTLTCGAQISGLMAQGELLPCLREIILTGEVAEAEMILALRERFPDAAVSYEQVKLLDAVYDAASVSLCFGSLTEEQAIRAGAVLSVFPDLTDVYLGDVGNVGAVSLDAAHALWQGAPELRYHYAVELFGQTLSTDMEQIDYFKTPIGDEGLAELEKLLPLMYNLSYFRLDWCETTDAAMAALRDRYADRFPVVWRVFFGKYNCLTDTYRIWANGITDEDALVLRYCTEVKYLDVGHSEELTNVEFLGYMPNLEVAIIGDCDYLTSIEPLRNCAKLEYLEVFTTSVSDLSPLSELTSLEHLNISGTLVEDLTPLDGLYNLKRLWSNRNDHLEDQVYRFRELYPNCRILTRGGHPIHYQWRYRDPDKQYKVPRYALLRKQIGYDTADMSCYPKGYLREEVTYESTGITPD